VDKIDNKLIYQNKLKALEYFWFDPFNGEDWAGFTFQDGIYQPIEPDTRNRLLSQRLSLALVRWHGVNEYTKTVWLRWATLEGELLPTPQENAMMAEQEAQVANKRAKWPNKSSLRQKLKSLVSKHFWLKNNNDEW
jgi:hypothetical protein